jgi:two-component system alkaline phosphatase synthesis response regulator PhoP
MVSEVKILVVDDEPDTIHLATRLLEMDGYQVIVAIDGEDALQKIYSEKPDIVLLDLMIPKKDGYTVCREIKSDSKMSDIIVIMFTVKMFDADRERGFEAGTDYYVTKPFSGEELRSLIRRILQNR